MKKIFIIMFVVSLMPALQAQAFYSPSSNDHNMIILREQQFRLQEIDTNKDFQEKKQKKLLEDEEYVKKVNDKKVIKSIQKPREFVEENGEIKIKGVE